jgi:hypothetical protein
LFVFKVAVFLLPTYREFNEFFLLHSISCVLLFLFRRFVSIGITIDFITSNKIWQLFSQPFRAVQAHEHVQQIIDQSAAAAK